MTRLSRAIRFPHVHLPILILFAAAGAVVASANAVAAPEGAPAVLHAGMSAGGAAGGEVETDDDVDDNTGPTGPFANGVIGDDSSADDTSGQDESPAAPAVPLPQADLLTAPTVETPLHHFYCVEYARLRSGIQIFGDAKTWWQHARNLYSEITQPVTDAVMVFAGSKRIRRGHLAVVMQVVSPREIRVDQANWQNHGEIDRYTPVLDVSASNDWSRVRVWDVGSGQFGMRVYAVKGFIVRPLASQEQASADLNAQAPALSPEQVTER